MGHSIGIIPNYSHKATFKFYKAVKRHYSDEVGNTNDYVVTNNLAQGDSETKK